MKGLKAEYLKTKNTPTIWFTVGCALFLPFVLFLIYVFRYKYFIPDENINPWIKYFSGHFNFLCNMFFPFYLVMSAALNLNIEHKSHSWKKLLLLPTSRTSIFLNKALFLALQTSVAIFLFFIAMLFFGCVAGIIHPELKLLAYLPDFSSSLFLLGRLLIISLGILTIQYTLSLFIKNTIIPVTLGIILVITALIITKSWEYSIYFPYSFTSVLYYVSEGKMNVAMWCGLTISEWLSLATSILVLIIGTWLFQRKEIK